MSETLIGVAVVVAALLVMVACFIGGYFKGYLSGSHRERLRHFIWMGDGWDKCSEHFDELEQNPGDDWAYIQLRYMTQIFGTERPYPIEEKEEK